MNIKSIIKELAMVISIEDIAKKIDRSQRQVRNYRQGVSEPSYSVGVKLIELHKEHKRKIARLKK